MSESRRCTPENACLLVKMEGDDTTYAVVLSLEARLMLIQLASSLSPKGVLEMAPFEGIEFKKPAIPSVTCQKPIIYAKTHLLAKEFARSKEWNIAQWTFVSRPDQLRGINKDREVYLVLNAMTATDVMMLHEESRARRFKLIEVTL